MSGQVRKDSGYNRPSGHSALTPFLPKQVSSSASGFLWRPCTKRSLCFFTCQELRAESPRGTEGTDSAAGGYLQGLARLPSPLGPPTHPTLFHIQKNHRRRNKELTSGVRKPMLWTEMCFPKFLCGSSNPNTSEVTVLETGPLKSRLS